MVRFGMVAAALALMAAPLLAQESTEQLKKELEQLRKEVDGLKAVNVTKEIPAQGKIDADAMAADDNPIMTMFKGVKLSGFVDAGYMVSFNQLHHQNNNDNPVRSYDNRDNSFYLHCAQIQLERLASKDMIVGFHVELQGGSDVAFIEGDTVALQEAWLQILAPIGTGLDIRVGKMATLIGYEVPESLNNQNYSRGAIWSMIQPITHTGVRASYSFVEQVSATIGFNNGMNVAGGDLFADLDHGKMVEMQLMVKPVKDLWFALNFVVGNDTDTISNSTSDKFYEFDLIVEYKMDKLTLALDYTKASSTNTPGGPRTPFAGLAVWAKYQLTDVFSSGIRLEYLSDELGTVLGPSAPGDTGTGSRIITVTLTEEFKIAQRLIFRIELRHDNSNNHDFSRGNSGPNNARGDTTLGFEAIMPF